MAAQASGFFRNPATGEITCTGDDRLDAWRSDKPLSCEQLAAFTKREAEKDEFQPEGGDWLTASDATVDGERYLIVSGVPIADRDRADEE